MKPAILLLTSSSRNFPLDMQEILQGANLESHRLASLSEFISSPLRREPFLAVLEVGNTEDIDRALLAYEWAESVQPFAAARFILLIGSKHLSLGDKASRFRGVEVAQLPLPARNILFKTDLQLKILNNPATKAPEGRGFRPQQSTTAEKERVLVFKGPGPKEGSWKAGEDSPQGKVRWRWVDGKPPISEELDFTWIVESKTAPTFDEQEEAWKAIGPESDLKCLQGKEEVFSALSAELAHEKAEEVKQESAAIKSLASKTSSEPIVPDEEKDSYVAPKAAVPEKKFSAEKEEKKVEALLVSQTVTGVSSLGAAKLQQEMEERSKLQRQEGSLAATRVEVKNHLGRDKHVVAPWNAPLPVGAIPLEEKSEKTQETISAASAESKVAVLAEESSTQAVGGKKSDASTAAQREAMFRSSRTETISSLRDSPQTTGEKVASSIGPAKPVTETISSQKKAQKTEAQRTEEKALAPNLAQSPTLESEQAGKLQVQDAQALGQKIPQKTSASSIAAQKSAEKKLPPPEPEEAGKIAKSAAKELPLSISEENGEAESGDLSPENLSPAAKEKPEEFSPYEKSESQNSRAEKEKERILLGSANAPREVVASSYLKGECSAPTASTKVSGDWQPTDPEHYLKMRHFLLLTLEELSDKNSSWYPIEGYRIYLSAQHRYYGFSRAEELFPLWIYEGELAPEFLDQQKSWKFYDRLPICYWGLAGLPEPVMRYLSVTISQNLPSQAGSEKKLAKAEPLAQGKAEIFAKAEKTKSSENHGWGSSLKRFFRKIFGLSD